jgi:hypothetical protein
VTAAAIKGATKALWKRLDDARKESTVPGTVFVGPLDDPGAKDAPLTLFLYRVVPNATLRNREHRVPSSTPGQVSVFQNALPLDLYYLLTVGKTSGGASEETLLQLLGYVMQALQTDPDLTGPDVNYETVRVTLEPLTTEEASRIWALFPTANYRTSIAYLATPVWIDPPQVTPRAAPVSEDQLFAGSKV